MAAAAAAVDPGMSISTRRGSVFERSPFPGHSSELLTSYSALQPHTAAETAPGSDPSWLMKWAAERLRSPLTPATRQGSSWIGRQTPLHAAPQREAPRGSVEGQGGRAGGVEGARVRWQPAPAGAAWRILMGSLVCNLHVTQVGRRRCVAGWEMAACAHPSSRSGCRMLAP